MSPKISIIILNWNSWEDTIECLESVYQIDYDNYNIILVDNNSEDDSLQMIKKYCKGNLKIESEFFHYNSNNKPINIVEYSEEDLKPLKLEIIEKKHSFKNKLILIKNQKNYGFSAGNNIGINFSLEQIETDYILLLNNDTVVDKEFLTNLVSPLESNEKIGISGPKTYYYNFKNLKNVINFAGGNINFSRGTTQHIGFGEIDQGQYNKKKIVDYVEGSCILIKKKVIQDVGLFDPNYFAYWEEIDFSMRALKKDYLSLYVPEAKIWHKVSSTSKGKLKTYYFNRNRFWFNKKYSNKKQYIIFILYFSIVEFGFRSLHFILFNRKNYKCFLNGIKDGFKPDY